MVEASRPGRVCRDRSRGQGGYTYLWVLVAIAVLGLGLSAAAEVWTTLDRRDRLAQLDWAGEQYVRAIGSYVAATPGPTRVYPAALTDLLEDRRQAVVRRHLRQLYPVPLAPQQGWILLTRTDGRIHGVRARVPASQGDIDKDYLFVER